MTSPPPIRILLVEDNRADARLISELLSEASGGPYLISTAQTLRDALSMLAGCDIVLLDLSLPDAQGLETAHRMLGQAGERPVVILTGNIDDSVATEAMKAGAQDYLVKSEVTPSLVAKTVRYAIERKKAEKTARRLIASQLARTQSDEAARRSQFLADAGAALSTSLDFHQIAQRLARLMVPFLADASVIDLVDRDGNVVRISEAARDPAVEQSLSLVRTDNASAHYRQMPSHRAILERRTVIIAALDDTELALIVPDPASACEVRRAIDPRSVLAVPMIIGERAVGAIGLVLTDNERTFAPEQVLLAEELARRAALAVENARLYREAQIAVRARDEVLAVVSHDLRNPLNVFQLAVDALRRICAGDVRGLELLNKADRAHVRMIRLLDDLLDVVRIDAGSLHVERQVVDLAEVLADVVDFQRTLAADKNISLQLLTEGARLVAHVDRDRFAQMMGNLLGNAVKFTADGGSIIVRAGRVGSNVLVEVTDSGVGIPPDIIDHVFDRFWQGSPKKKLGVGLGLAIAKGIVEAHDGSISVRSESGKGACFCVTLPCGE